MAEQSRRAASLWLLFFLHIVIGKRKKHCHRAKTKVGLCNTPTQIEICFVDSSNMLYIAFCSPR